MSDQMPFDHITNDVSKLTVAEAERLHYLVETCGDVVTAATKILRHGYQSYNPLDPAQVNNRQALEHRLDQVLLALTVMQRVGDINKSNIPMEDYVFETFKAKILWFHHQEEALREIEMQTKGVPLPG